jgi:protoporphyrinogen oxidase
VVLGAGPAGLAAAHALAARNRRPLVLEADEVVGGIARTVVRDGFRFDLGGHRFLTKSEEVEHLWRELLRDDLLLRPRLSRIYWNGRFVEYPLRAGDLVARIGPRELVRCGASYLAAALRPNREAESFEAWVTQRFGRRLYELFFRAYSEKVWGVPGREIRAEWAAQRIRELSLGRAALSSLPGVGSGGVRTLVGEFLYPRLGPGQMWERMADEIVTFGGELRLRSPVTRLRLHGNRVVGVEAGDVSIEPGAVISSLPLSTAVAIADPPPAADVRRAAAALRYRDFITVALVLRGDDPFPDNWIYVHDPKVKVGRIQNFRSWSPAMVPDPELTCVGLEYFCFQGDVLWRMDDEALIELATTELVSLGLAEREQVECGYVERVPRAYPLYDESYSARLDRIRDWLGGIENLQQIGRNGLHRYNNSDHSMLTGLRAVENLLDDTDHDIWAVNADSVYHEEAVREEHPYRTAPVPSRAGDPAAEQAKA